MVRISEPGDPSVHARVEQKRAVQRRRWRGLTTAPGTWMIPCRSNEEAITRRFKPCQSAGGERTR